jgi:MFS transporter, DHA1 family, inner membrane transport protein
MTAPTGNVRIGTVRLVVLKLVLNTAVRLVYPFLPTIARGLDITIGQAGALISMRWVAGFASPVAIGLAGPRATSRALLLGGLGIFAVGSLVTAWFGAFVGAAIGFALIGFAKPLFDVGAQAHIAERVPWHRRSRHIGLLEVSWAGGLLVGAPIAGWLIERGSWNTPFLVLGLLAAFGIGAVAVLERVETETAVDIGEKPKVQGPALWFLVVGGIVGYALEILLVNLGTWLEGSFGLALLALGGVGIVIGVAELLGEGGVVAITDRVNKRKALALSLALAAVAFVALGFVADSLVVGVGVLAVGIALVEYTIVSGMSVATEIHPSNRTGYLAWFAVATGVGRIAGDLTGPWMFGVGGMRLPSFAAAASALAAAALLIRLPNLDATPPEKSNPTQG